MNETGANLDTVVDSLVDTLRNIGDSMNRAGDSLIALAENSHGAQGRQNMEQYVRCFQTSATGNYWWS